MRLFEADAAGTCSMFAHGGLAEVGDGVDEGDFEGKECVGGVLDDFGGLGGGEQQGGGAAAEHAAGNGVWLRVSRRRR